MRELRRIGRLQAAGPLSGARIIPRHRRSLWYDAAYRACGPLPNRGARRPISAGRRTNSPCRRSSIRSPRYSESNLIHSHGRNPLNLNTNSHATSRSLPRTCARTQASACSWSARSSASRLRHRSNRRFATSRLCSSVARKVLRKHIQYLLGLAWQSPRKRAFLLCCVQR